MNDNNINKFQIDICVFNENLKNYLLSQLGKTWKPVTKLIDSMYVHIGIGQLKSDPIWIGTEEVPDHMLFCIKQGDEVKTAVRKNEISYADMEERELKDIVLYNMKKELAGCGCKCDEENAVFGWGEQIYDGIKSGARYTSNQSVATLYTAWIISFDKWPDDERYPALYIYKLMVEIVLRFLCEGFTDIGYIKQGSLKEEASIAFGKVACRSRFSFLDEYVKHVFKKHCLPQEEYCRELSFVPYEKRECKGKIYLADASLFAEEETDRQVRFCDKKERKFSDIYGVRKLLEVCGQKQYLLADTSAEHCIYGFGNEDIDGRYCDLISIQYMGIANWCVRIGREVVLSYQRGSYCIGKEISGRNLSRNLENLNKIPVENIEKVICLLEQAEHGALLIIAEDAVSEADRLCVKLKRGIRIEGFKAGDKKEKEEVLEERMEMIKSMSNVDGAILMDFKGNCVAFGVVLDGEATVTGSVQRGSRYNSAVNYIAGKNRIAVIVSEDKDKPIAIEVGTDKKEINQECE